MLRQNFIVNLRLSLHMIKLIWPQESGWADRGKILRSNQLASHLHSVVMLSDKLRKRWVKFSTIWPPTIVIWHPQLSRYQNCNKALTEIYENVSSFIEIRDVSISNGKDFDFHRPTLTCVSKERRDENLHPRKSVDSNVCWCQVSTNGIANDTKIQEATIIAQSLLIAYLKHLLFIPFSYWKFLSSSRDHHILGWTLDIGNCMDASSMCHQRHIRSEESRKCWIKFKFEFSCLIFENSFN